MNLQPRLELPKVAPGIYPAMAALEDYIAQCSLERPLIELVKLRASQINGCAYCIDMHSKDARALGEAEQRLYGLDAWRETSYYTPRERAALAWTEAVTLVHQTHAPDEVYDEVCEQFTTAEVANLTFVIATINAWNRLAVSLRAVPGKYQPAKTAADGPRATESADVSD